MENESITLCELLLTVRKEIANTFSDAYWIRAEISEIRENANGHCYLELIEKDSSGKLIVAKSRASIWADTYKILKPYFVKETGQELKPGMKLMVQVSVSFHEVYGFNCTIRDIEPTFTLGDLAKKRLETIKQLHDDGIWDMNQSLELPMPLNRIAIITSSTAAGYGDFIDQLQNNKSGFKFKTRLFPAIMQGDGAAESIIEALDTVYEIHEKYDAVAIIRGGGSTTDLLAYDEYELAASCAQFPLPIITGIGHDRDQSVVDMVANIRCKTPTAVAAFIIDQMDETANHLLDLEETMKQQISDNLEMARKRLKDGAVNFSQRINLLLKEEEQTIERDQINFKHVVSLLLMKQKQELKDSSIKVSQRLSLLLKEEKQAVERSQSDFLHIISLLMMKQKQKLNVKRDQFKTAVKNLFSEEKHELAMHEKSVQFLSPDYILKKGYTLTLKDGKAVKSQAELKSGDLITSVFADGKKESIIK